jgi:hypothetical protein
MRASVSTHRTGRACGAARIGLFASFVLVPFAFADDATAGSTRTISEACFGTLATRPAKVHREAVDAKICRRAQSPAAPAPDVKVAVVPACPRVNWAAESSPVDEYLCSVYWRMPRKIDDAGDFTWKDAAAAARVDRTVCEYAIEGMHRNLREALYTLGRQADEAGISWSLLSGFRDDYRQSIATGHRAQLCQSLHGGSCRTNGWGDGQAADLWVADQNGEPAKDASPLFELINRVGRSLGLSRPMPGGDPPHVQVTGEWQRIGDELREKRLGVVSAAGD